MAENCFHCGQEIDKDRIFFDEKAFCCNGCKSVYEILNANNLGNFYELNKNSGIRPDENLSQFDYLDTPEIFEKVVDFSEGNTSVVTFKIPVIHCSSCIWLLESLQDLNANIRYSQVNFTKKTLQVSFNQNELPLSELAKFLTNLGYKPVISLETADKKEATVDRSLTIKVAVAGFAFGNAMMFAFPEYLNTGSSVDFWLEEFAPFFRFLTFLLSIPVVVYSASDYYKSAWFGLKNKIVNIDVPIVLGILVLFFRSVYEIATNYGPGYFDTLCGLLFFMLLGKIVIYILNVCLVLVVVCASTDDVCVVVDDRHCTKCTNQVEVCHGFPRKAFSHTSVSYALAYALRTFQFVIDGIGVCIDSPKRIGHIFKVGIVG